jgi:hypothetical protein
MALCSQSLLCSPWSPLPPGHAGVPVDGSLQVTGGLGEVKAQDNKKEGGMNLMRMVDAGGQHHQLWVNPLNWFGT